MTKVFVVKLDTLVGKYEAKQQRARYKSMPTFASALSFHQPQQLCATRFYFSSPPPRR